MTGWLLDTNVISELRRPSPDKRVVKFITSQSLGALFVSAVTLAEIRYGIEMISDVSRRADLAEWLMHKVRPMFEQRVLPVSEDVMLKWRIMVDEGRKAGHTYSQPDVIIAATAAHHGLTVVTRDVSDFERARVACFNPWNGPTSAPSSRKMKKPRVSHR